MGQRVLVQMRIFSKRLQASLTFFIKYFLFKFFPYSIYWHEQSNHKSLTAVFFGGKWAELNWIARSEKAEKKQTRTPSCLLQKPISSELTFYWLWVWNNLTLWVSFCAWQGFVEKLENWKKLLKAISIKQSKGTKLHHENLRAEIKWTCTTEDNYLIRSRLCRL